MQPEKGLPYENQIIWGGMLMQAMRDSFDICQEGDMVNIFRDKMGNYLAIAFGLRNMGFYIGVVMTLGAPIGFGRVMYMVGDKAFTYYSNYPQEPIEIEAESNGSFLDEL